MIKATEFRIGNYYLPTDGSLGPVKVTADDLKAWSMGAVYGKEIPLTPEIFLSCGFIEGAMLDNSFINDELYFDLIEGHYYLRNGEIDNFSRPIDFLHQLQNINLDLTGKELEIKELQHA